MATLELTGHQLKLLLKLVGDQDEAVVYVSRDEEWTHARLKDTSTQYNVPATRQASSQQWLFGTQAYEEIK